MKITSVEALHLRLPVVEEIADGTQECLIVRVQTDDGYTGLGEVVSCASVARAVIEAPRAAPFRHGLAVIVKGMDAADIGAVHQAMIEGTTWYGRGGVVRHAISGIDLALWDIRGKAAGKPVRRMLNPHAVDSLPCYASTLWPARPEEVAGVIEACRPRGGNAVKLGWGPMGRDPELDVALVAAARRALGPDGMLMVDAGRVWDAETALKRIERFRPYRLHWLEEPLRPGDIAGYHRLAREASVPIAAGEACTLAEEFSRHLLDAGVAIVQPDLGRVGGITGVEELEQLRSRAGVRLIPHVFGTPVLQAASAQWMAARSEPLLEAAHTRSPLLAKLARSGMTFRNGIVRLDDAPGFGVELDAAIVEEYRV